MGQPEYIISDIADFLIFLSKYVTIFGKDTTDDWPYLGSEEKNLRQIRLRVGPRFVIVNRNSAEPQRIPLNNLVCKANHCANWIKSSRHKSVYPRKAS